MAISGAPATSQLFDPGFGIRFEMPFFGAPPQARFRWSLHSQSVYDQKTIQKAYEIAQKHLACYQLLLSRGTAFLLSFPSLDTYDYVGLTRREILKREGERKKMTPKEIEEQIEFEREWSNCCRRDPTFLDSVQSLPPPRYLHLFIPAKATVTHERALFGGVLKTICTTNDHTHLVFRISFEGQRFSLTELADIEAKQLVPKGLLE